MKKLFPLLCAALMLAACTTSEEQLKQRAGELCRYIPDHQLAEGSKEFMTEDFYAVLDTMFSMPEFEAMDHEWLYYFVTGNGGTIADYEVKAVECIDRSHAVATILVRQLWEDGSAADDDLEEHNMLMERVNGKWLMADFDGHKADCIRHIAINRHEQQLREAIYDYLTREIGAQYLQGDLCIPVLMIVDEESGEDGNEYVWGDFWVFNYQIAGDTLKTVSGGSHPGKLTISEADGRLYVSEFERVEDGAGYQASAKRIFGTHYDVYEAMHANENVREYVRAEQLRYYIRIHELNYRSYQDYGWPAVEL